MRTKYENIKDIRTSTINYDIIVFAETWLRQGIENGELYLHNCVIHRNDRNSKSSGKKRGGGVLIAISKHLQSCEVTVDSVNIEQLFITIFIDNTGLQGFVVEKLWIVSGVIFDVEFESEIRISLSRQDFEIFEVKCSKNGTTFEVMYKAQEIFLVFFSNVII